MAKQLEVIRSFQSGRYEMLWWPVTGEPYLENTEIKEVLVQEILSYRVMGSKVYITEPDGHFILDFKTDEQISASELEKLSEEQQEIFKENRKFLLLENKYGGNTPEKIVEQGKHYQIYQAGNGEYYYELYRENGKVRKTCTYETVAVITEPMSGILKIDENRVSWDNCLYTYFRIADGEQSQLYYNILCEQDGLIVTLDEDELTVGDPFVPDEFKKYQLSGIPEKVVNTELDTVQNREIVSYIESAGSEVITKTFLESYVR